MFITSDLLDGDKRSGSERNAEESSAGRDNTGGTLWVMYGGSSRASSSELSSSRWEWGAWHTDWFGTMRHSETLTLQEVARSSLPENFLTKHHGFSTETTKYLLRFISIRHQIH